MKRPAIPAPSNTGQEVARVLYPIKEIIDHITGVTSGELSTLATTATLDDAIAKVNEIINRLNRNGA